MIPIRFCAKLQELTLQVISPTILRQECEFIRLDKRIIMIIRSMY